MKRRTHRHWLKRCRQLLVISLAVAPGWNLMALYFELTTWWLGLLLPLVGVVGWVGLAILPVLQSESGPPYPDTYRLLYSAPDSWRDTQARQALLNLVRSGTGLDIIWAKEGEDIGCWLSVASHGLLLQRLVQDIFPEGLLEPASLPEIGQGVMLLHWAENLGDMPTPTDLCQQAGIEGVYFRWRSEQVAVVAIWGPEAHHLAAQLAQPDDFISGQGRPLLNAPFKGDNPWPELPPFPPSTQYPGLAAVAQLEYLAPALRTNGQPALIIGQDADRHTIGFPLPELDGLEYLQIVGQAAEAIVIEVVQQAVRVHQPLCLLDGQGIVTTRLARHLLRQVATEKVLICDVERPAQSHFRLNPLWLPEDDLTRQAARADGWLAWLRELGVTPGGLGQTAFWHTQVAVILTALLSQQRTLTLDVPGLREALLAPKFLRLGDVQTWAADNSLAADIWDWWRTEGQQATNFETHLRLAHLRDRLGALLELPEYSVLWRGPYLNPLMALSNGQTLFWRLPDPRRRLSAYLNSQLLALHTLLLAWPPEQPPLLIILHELDAGTWLKRLHKFPSVRLIVSATGCQVNSWPDGRKPSTLLVSRLAPEDARQLRLDLPGIRASDLQRLPPQRLIFKRGSELCTVDMNE